jgi:hypothetical protein
MLHLLKAVIVIALVIWAIGFFFAHLGGLIHIALVIAAIALVWHLVAGAAGGGRTSAY